MRARADKSTPTVPSKEALVREILERVADRWTLLVIDALDGRREVRFSRLRERIGGVSQRMLTKTLRQLERDGLVKRRVHPEVPPRVDYKLTPLGESLGKSVCSIWTSVEAHMRDVEQSRRTFDTSARARTNPSEAISGKDSPDRGRGSRAGSSRW